MHLHYKYIILRIYIDIMHYVIKLILIQKIRILTSPNKIANCDKKDIEKET
jgi:hypothetical protein